MLYVIIYFFLFFLFLILYVYCLTVSKRDGCCSFLMINLRGHKNRTYYLIGKGKEPKNAVPFENPTQGDAVLLEHHGALPASWQEL